MRGGFAQRMFALRPAAGGVECACSCPTRERHRQRNGTNHRWGRKSHVNPPGVIDKLERISHPFPIFPMNFVSIVLHCDTVTQRPALLNFISSRESWIPIPWRPRIPRIAPEGSVPFAEGQRHANAGEQRGEKESRLRSDLPGVLLARPALTTWALRFRRLTGYVPLASRVKARKASH